jgi:hypothetical protein
MDNAGNTVLISDIASDVLADIAPQEVPIFPAISQAYFADPAGALKQLRSKDAALSFGVDPLSILLTPVVLHIVSEVFKVLTEAAKKAVEDGLAKEIPEVIKAMLKRFRLSGPSIPSPLGKAQLVVIHEKVLLAAMKLRIPKAKADALANVVTAQLVIAE